ncbi:hypothetical protein GALMADRAFT_725248 [Galerina marginata CBS 339.88]|uniref:Uncharacterized protein n=1 Tax=Galerina marginata (strain CBS 339.88) TaxID=685588 RepID=A0A067T2H1_GALM3|nr:hypothetical protein GALMADRAFT_725248 [Galerina marginata CBS 339.88]
MYRPQLQLRPPAHSENTHDAADTISLYTTDAEGDDEDDEGIVVQSLLVSCLLVQTVWRYSMYKLYFISPFRRPQKPNVPLLCHTHQAQVTRIPNRNLVTTLSSLRHSRTSTLIILEMALTVLPLTDCSHHHQKLNRRPLGVGLPQFQYHRRQHQLLFVQPGQRHQDLSCLTFKFPLSAGLSRIIHSKPRNRVRLPHCSPNIV